MAPLKAIRFSPETPYLQRGSGSVLNLCHVANVGVELSGLARSDTADRRLGLDGGRGQSPLMPSAKTEAIADLAAIGQAPLSQDLNVSTRPARSAWPFSWH